MAQTEAVRRTVNYLTTLDLDDGWLDALGKSCPDLEIRRLVASSAAEIPDEVWAQIDVLHTGYVFPDLAKAPRLRWIQLDTSGVEHVREHPVWSSDVEITTLGGIAPVPMAEFTIMSLLGLAHHQPLLDAHRRDRSWPTPADRLATLTPRPVDGATVTIVGYGRIGREVARLATALGMRVVGVSRRGADGPDRSSTHFDTGRSGDRPVVVEHRRIDELAQVLPATDYLVVIVPRTDETVGLIGSDEFALLPAGASLVNVARGGIVDETALLAALDSGHLSYAALDVFDDEPLAGGSPWWSHPRVVVTPHVAGLAPRYSEQVLELLSTNVVRYEEGRPLLNRADRAAGY